MAIRSLGDADASCGAKAHGLARLIAAGLPVPEGFVIEADAFREVAAMDDVAPDAIGHALEAAAQRIATAALPVALEREVAERAAALGRLAVRSSASIEDGALGAAAGVFASLTDVAPGEVWPAIRAVWTSALTPLAVAYARRRAAAIAISVIVQRFAPGARMTVYTRPIGAPRGDELWLQRDGDLERIARTAAGDRAEAALAMAAEAAIDASNGADVELVDLSIVQARPIVHPVRPTRQPPPAILLAPLVEDGRRWTWDIAHNPDPLSPAQTGLVERIDRTPWSPHALRVCAGYLYTTPRAAPPAPEPPADRAELAARIAAIEPRLAGLLHADAASAGNAIEAVDRYVAFLQIWLCELSPLIAAARRKLLDRLGERGYPLERIAGLAASMIGPRRGVRDPVMSPAWDVAAPTFAEMPAADARSVERLPSPAPPIDPSACGDLATEVELARAAADAAERDDLWFARAQWRVRSALLARSRELGVSGDDIFWIPLDDAITLRSLDPDDVHRRASAARAAHARAAQWDMPLVVHGGDARSEMPSETHEITLRGVGFGPRTVGRVVRFASLATARSVARGDVVVTRAVTPSLAMLVEKCAALVSETGGLLDHGAALARELGITCVVGCTGAWTQLDDGTVVCVDGDAGVVSPL
jgi:phosphohistidine swiveling domain-containing protein